MVKEDNHDLGHSHEAFPAPEPPLVNGGREEHDQPGPSTGRAFATTPSITTNILL